MNQITILFFATFKERAGTKHANLEIAEGTTVGELKSLVEDKFPNLSDSMGSVLVSVNKEYAFDEEVIPADAEVALFPPVSGGTMQDDSFPTVFSITDRELDLNAILESITLPTTGAACFFTGMVREVTSRGDSHETDFLEYEAYKPMAEQKMNQVADEIREKWESVEGIAIVQRIGKLHPGEPTVMIACTAGHRDTGVFEAARYGIDRLKQIVPIWKKEVGPDGQVWVEGKYFPSPGE
ncbi:MAG: molybdopterin converting factor subunit 1 [Chloroflexi bacterium]|nr:molybdopterin converting factor subunit 1 [Chloroflexota bacterium]